MVREVVGTKRLIYRDDKKDTFHVYTPQELEQERQIVRISLKSAACSG